MGMMWMGIMGMGNGNGDGDGEQEWDREQERGNGNGNGNGNELLTIILYYLCAKSYTYPVSAKATYTSPSNNPKSFNSQGRHMLTKILLFIFFHYYCPLYH
jgi:hypothetical protein